jgi:hypothetical protein
MRRRARGVVAPASKTSRGVESFCESDSQNGSEKFAVASGDRAKTEFSRKYFCCQKMRLRVRETLFWTAEKFCPVLLALRCVLYCDQGSCCGTVVSLKPSTASLKRFA